MRASSKRMIPTGHRQRDRHLGDGGHVAWIDARRGHGEATIRSGSDIREPALDNQLHEIVGQPVTVRRKLPAHIRPVISHDVDPIASSGGANKRDAHDGSKYTATG